MLGNPSDTAQERLRPIDLGGGLVIATPVILAPMSGVTDLPFLKLIAGYGGAMGAKPPKSPESKPSIHFKHESLVVPSVSSSGVGPRRWGR